MKTLAFMVPTRNQFNSVLQYTAFAGVFLLAWQILPALLTYTNPTTGLVDDGIWQLLLFAVITFWILFTSSLVLFRLLLRLVALPKLENMVLQFEHLKLWEQFVFYWASFALLFSGSIGCLIAVL